MVNTWLSEVINVCHKEMELSCGNGKKLEVQIWPWPLTPKSTEVLLRSWSTRVKYHHCIPKGNGVIMRKPLFLRQDGQTDGWMDGWTNNHGETSIPPTTSLAGGITRLWLLQLQPMLCIRWPFSACWKISKNWLVTIHSPHSYLKYSCL